MSERFSQQIIPAGETVRADSTDSNEIPNWARVLSAFPDMPNQLRVAVKDDRQEFGQGE